MIIDAVIFNDETEMLEFRMKYLWNYVDRFVVVEADRTHSGKAKPYNLVDRKIWWAKDKLVYYKAEIDISDLNLDYKPTEYEPEAPQWKIENRQRNAILDACKYFSNDDIIMISDCDEIPSIQAVEFRKNNDLQHPMSCDQAIIPLNLNCLNDTTTWRGTVMTKLSYAREVTPQKIRDMRNQYSPFPNGGWHLTYFGGAEKISNKIKSFAHQELNKPEITDKEYIQHCLDKGLDIFTAEPGGLKRIDDTYYPEEFLKHTPKGWWL